MIYDEIILNEKGEEVTLKSKYTVCITGHRKVEENFDYNKVKQEIINSINLGYDTFLDGMAYGFDQGCLEVLFKLKEEYNFRVIACIPCINQDLKWSEKVKKLYRKYLSLCDDVIYVTNEPYSATCMKQRNKFMVEHSKRCICYIRDEISGTGQTYKMAKEKGLDIVLL